MRNPDRIKPITDKLCKLWSLFPDFRFWQLISLLEFPEDKRKTDPFFWEDDVWDEAITKALEVYSNGE